MVINKQIEQEIADRYFHGRMPQDFKAYLYDRYSEDPIPGEVDEISLINWIREDSEKYLRGELDTTVRTEYQKLQDRFDEMSGFLSAKMGEIQSLEHELQVHLDFLEYHRLLDEFHRFEAQPPEKISSPDAPFPFYPDDGR